MKDVWLASLRGAHEALHSLMENDETIEKCAALASDLVTAFRMDKKVLICGNGGSHCDALHFAEEFTGRYRKDRRPLPVLALGEAAHVTCVGNDYGFDKIFARQAEAFGQKGDLLICLTTSGNSANILEALTVAKQKGVTTWALLGKDGGKAKSLAQKSLIVPGSTTDRIQELHMMILHIAIEHVERVLFPENYK